MVDNRYKNIEKIQSGKHRSYTLERILKANPSLETDVMDFLLIAGWCFPYRGPLYQKLDKMLKETLRGYVKERREILSTSEKNMETRFYHWILEGGYGKRFKTLGEFKKIIESEGIRIKNLHYKTLAHFNKTLKEYRIEPIRVGGRYTPAVLMDLQKYDLEPARKK